MSRINFILITIFLIVGCKETTQDNKIVETRTEFNQDLVDELKKMVEIDQVAASNAFPPSEYADFTQEKWELFKDSIYRTNQKRTKEIFDKYGFVGYDLAGKEGSNHFLLIVQHADHDPEFQNEVLQSMKIEVANENAEPKKYGMLVDRVKLNSGNAQIYGSQVQYNKHTGRAYPKQLADSVNVNKRRKSIGLEPLETYLDQKTQMHFEMNKELFIIKGITVPKLYETE